MTLLVVLAMLAIRAVLRRSRDTWLKFCETLMW